CCWSSVVDPNSNTLNTDIPYLHGCARDNPAFHASACRVENSGDPLAEADLPCDFLVHGLHGNTCIHHKCHWMPVDRSLNIEVLVMRSLDNDGAVSTGRHCDLWRDECVKTKIGDRSKRQPE